MLHGEYKMERCYQVGEGGMMICSRFSLSVGEQVVVSFFMTFGSLIIVRGVVRSVVPKQAGKMAGALRN